jgi:hypothetical protein
MGLFNFFSKEADNGTTLLHPGNFVSHYLLTTSNEFVMGKENPVLSVTTESNILLSQTVGETDIQTEVTLQSITGKTDSPVLQI